MEKKNTPRTTSLLQQVADKDCNNWKDWKHSKIHTHAHSQVTQTYDKHHPQVYTLLHLLISHEI